MQCLGSHSDCLSKNLKSTFFFFSNRASTPQGAFRMNKNHSKKGDFNLYTNIYYCLFFFKFLEHTVITTQQKAVYDRTKFTEYRSFGSVGSRNTEPNLLDIFGHISWVFFLTITLFFSNFLFLSQKNAIKC